MSDTVIQVESLWKEYRLGVISHHTLTRDLQSWWARVRGKEDPNSQIGSAHPSRSEDRFWALQDVSFEVKQGEILGIIGRNGAGKSTLLKILSQVTAPTKGEVRFKGRIASLLEVGTGFHPELTGRENIFLNGAILGMSKNDICDRLDEIVAFAEVEKFIDTPVKRYSSGMYVRLAFAVAAHLEPEILIVDEVLAVGDAQFQKKCLGKLESVGKEGRTVLFVSHDMTSITRLCDRAILLYQGHIVNDGPADEVAGSYMDTGLGVQALRLWPDMKNAPGNNIVRLRSAKIKLEDGSHSETIDIRSPLGIEIEYDVFEEGHLLVPNYNLRNREGIVLFFALDQDTAWKEHSRCKGRYKSTAWVPGNFFAEGIVIVNIAITTFMPFHVHIHERDAVVFQIVDSLDGDSARREFGGSLPGVVRPLLRWTTDFEAVIE